jgi:hypothetical protein
MDVDFKDRSVLNLITTNGYSDLMKSDKVAALLDELWAGKETYECNGKTADFSILRYLSSSKIKSLPKQSVGVN